VQAKCERSLLPDSCVFHLCRLNVNAHYSLIAVYSTFIALGIAGNLAIALAFLTNKVSEFYTYMSELYTYRYQIVCESEF
jgi:hypothetical protein